jgi:peptidoglycan/xylan/chitin deacetylase (PgdA/CDA1 family)
MRRLASFVPFAVLVVTACVAVGVAACSAASSPGAELSPAAGGSAGPTGSPSPSPTASPSPSASASPATSGTPGTKPVVTPSHSPCAEGEVTVNQARVTRDGPNGSVRVTGSEGVALTFDDGPDPVNTPAMLQVLRACGVKATFCLVGVNVVSHPDIVRMIVADGHTLCNHTWQHNTKLGSSSPEAIRQDLQRTNDAIHAIVPLVPVAYFRAPGGAWTDKYVAVARELGMTSIDWDVDPWDWNFKVNGTGDAMTQHIVTHVKNHVRPGSIILSHDFAKPTTVEAYRRLMPWLTARYQLIALPVPEDRRWREPPI